ncbi:NAD(P)/FAD-dependent oxidoreductase [Maritimibacter sp. DP1N21-5]|uniref:FAD-dependent oxidoreductase n=1 Tax=Maritimibacter sp. DP1N21-5 TaxID=2836867 RepID=UPI001C471436|nr:NAD(P)/FAD-dependent oxidoreductase [Maritimibacter sp. DP1N21-5]MBV7407829.1 FAD-dependent monooxygenase [Maritimibacter sp. DP1N21-5]
MTARPLWIGIAGAGIGGLATAALLARAGHSVEVHDRFDRPAPVGSGLVIQPVGRRVLQAIGVEAVALSQGQILSGLLGTSVETGGPVLVASYGQSADAKGLGIHRSVLFDLLLEAATGAGAVLVPSSEVVGQAGDKFALTHGQSRRYDLLIDATGAGSRLSPLAHRILPFGAIWATVDWVSGTFPKDELTQKYHYADRMMGVLPIGGVNGARKAALFWSLPRDGYDAWRHQGVAAWRDVARAHWPQAAPFADQITDPDQFTMARYAHGTLLNPVRENLVHIGDAAHRTSPQLGQGANMALLDAFALSQALALHPHTLTDALRTYAWMRRVHVWGYQALSAAFTPQYQSESRALAHLRNRCLYPLSRVWPVPRLLTRLVQGDLLPPITGLPRN